MTGISSASHHFSHKAEVVFTRTRHNEDSAQTLARHYLLSCTACGATFDDDGYMLDCTSCHTPGLLVSRYHAKELRVSEEEGIFRYRSWLPVQRNLFGPGRTITYQSKKLSALTGLKRLWIAFNGYWPELDAYCLSGTFKELEAYCVLGRLPADDDKVLVVASAGNTASAFARVCSLNSVRCLIVIPQSGLAHMRFEDPIASCVKVVTVTGTGDYMDAIRLAGHAAKMPGFFAEGGAKNVARRDGLGTVLLNAYETIGRLPEYYFQAIGSGTGAIAVHECARRVSADNAPPPRLCLSQNLPFAPIYEAWRAGVRAWPQLLEGEAKLQISQIQAPVLANRLPPYSLRGGLYDALMESQGEVLAVTNDQARSAAQLFEESEGIDIDPAAAVSFASLLTSTATGHVPADATVVLNVTGGGRLRYFAKGKCTQTEADLQIDSAAIDSTCTLSEIAGLFAGARKKR
jgi:cysteate synthase